MTAFRVKDLPQEIVLIIVGQVVNDFVWKAGQLYQVKRDRVSELKKLSIVHPIFRMAAQAELFSRVELCREEEVDKFLQCIKNTELAKHVKEIKIFGVNTVEWNITSTSKLATLLSRHATSVHTITVQGSAISIDFQIFLKAKALKSLHLNHARISNLEKFNQFTKLTNLSFKRIHLSRGTLQPTLADFSALLKLEIDGWN